MHVYYNTCENYCENCTDLLTYIKIFLFSLPDKNTDHISHVAIQIV